MATQDILFLWIGSIKDKLFEKSPKDIIVFKLPGQENINYVKRLIGLPGETIKVESGKVLIKSKNSNSFKEISQKNDGIFIDTQFKNKSNNLLKIIIKF